MEDDSDDDFDETTLWEIANLLNSKDVPSKNSLLPQPRAALEEYSSDESDTEDAAVVKPPQMRLPIQPLEMVSRESPRASIQLPTLDLWTMPAAVIERADSGLFSKPASGHVIRTTSSSPVAAQMLAAPRKATVDLPTLVSNSLWTPVVAEKQDVMWIVKQKMSSPRAIPAQSSTGMWSAAEKVIEVATVGLFNASIPRSTFRTTQATPAAASMICKARNIQQPLDTLVSSKLWSHKQKLNIERDWISESSVRPRSPSIYSASSSRASSPTSDASSVRSTSTKASSVTGFAAIPSWWDNKRSKNSPPSLPEEENRPASKIPVRQPSKPLAPVRESRVLASRDMWEAKAPVLERTPSRNLRRATINRQPAKPTRQAMRQQYRPNGTFQADWEEALNEAIAASRTKPALRRGLSKSKIAQPVVAKKAPKVARPAASKADWSSALAEAISRSQPRVQRPLCTPAMWEDALATAISMSTIPQAPRRSSYDAAILHPVFFTKALVSNASDIHPAAIGHVSKNYDAATLHPVFFTESLTSSIADIHPAAIGHVTVQKMESPKMWSPAVATPLPRPSLLWTNSAVTTQKRPTGSIMETTLVRRPLPAKGLDLPVLQSTSFWKPSPAAVCEINWLTASKPATPQTWTPRETHLADNNDNTGMWVAKAKHTVLVPDQFAHIAHVHVKVTTSRPIALPRLTSTSLFSKSPRSDINPPHWLHRTSKVAKSTTWTAPTPMEPASQVGMWVASPQRTSVSPDLFARVKHEHLRATPSRSASNTLPVLVSSKLFEVSAVPAPITHWLQQTSRSTARSMTWTAPENVVELRSEAGMWAAPSQQPRSASPDLFAHIKAAHVRAVPSRSNTLPVLLSSSLFEVSAAPAPVTHWLQQTSRSTTRSMTWTAPENVVELRSEAGMWAAPSQQPRSASPDLFAHVKAAHVRAPPSRSSTLPVLASSELFAVVTAQESTTHWLHQTSKAGRSATWTAPLVQSPKEQDGMWMPVARSASPSPDLFAHIKSNTIRATAPRSTALPEISSTSLFAHQPSSVESPHWLHKTSKTTIITPRARSTTWTRPARIITPVTEANTNNNNLWSASTIIPRAIPSPMIFTSTHPEPWTRPKRSDSAVSGLESTELWRQTSPTETTASPSSKNWLVHGQESSA